MRIVMFYHSLISDWNHGNAHFLRGISSELVARGHEVAIYEDRDAWSVTNLLAETGPRELIQFRTAYPTLNSIRYEQETLDLDDVLRGADLVLVHEWNPPELIERIGLHRALRGDYRLFFHDTHHRAVSDPQAISVFNLTNYDGVLAFGEVLRHVYAERESAERVWTWHEAADTRTFYPFLNRSDANRDQFEGDLVWIGNWGDGERNEELREFLIQPVRELGIKARVYGVRYPEAALKELHEAGIEYGGWLPNYRVPETFSRFRITVHIPRRPYLRTLPGIPTIRVFEALACGIPLVCSYWPDIEHLFEPGSDYLVAKDGAEMKRHLALLLANPNLAQQQAEHGLQTIRARHTCAHRVDELLHIASEVCATSSGTLQ